MEVDRRDKVIEELRAEVTQLRQTIGRLQARLEESERQAHRSAADCHLPSTQP